MMETDDVTIKLSKNEAIILFEFLSRFSNESVLQIKHQSEERVLWNLTCDLEKITAELFDKNYLSTLKEAQEAVEDK